MSKTGKKAKIGIIGCGRIARQGHLPYLKENPNAEVVAIMDVNADCRAKTRKQFDIPSEYGAPAEMFENESLDGVLICTPNWVHKDLTLMAAKHGCNVFCEKPMARNSEEAGEMRSACEKAGVNLQIGMVKRFDAGIVKVKKMIKSGDLGLVSHIATSCLTPPARTDSQAFELIKKWAAAFGKNIEEEMGLWRITDERTCGGHLMEMGTHLIDLLLYLADEDPLQWSGFINKKRDDMVWEDQGSLLIRFPSGLIATADMNMSVTSNNLLGENGKVFGDKASIHFSHINGMWFGLPEPVYYYLPTFVFKLGPLSPFTGVKIPLSVKTGKNVYMHKLQMDYFVDSILGRDLDYFGSGSGIAANGEDGHAVMKIIDQAYSSSRAAKQVDSQPIIEKASGKDNPKPPRKKSNSTAKKKKSPVKSKASSRNKTP